jgi:multidrug efflux pump subunit AcrA (membrane-fusion protein)
VIWRSVPGLTVPVTAVSRVNGAFRLVAEPAGTGFVARQRPVQIGEVLGNDYVVRGGLKPGERLIVAGIQKIGDGMPVKPE